MTTRTTALVVTAITVASAAALAVRTGHLVRLGRRTAVRTVRPVR